MELPNLGPRNVARVRANTSKITASRQRSTYRFKHYCLPSLSPCEFEANVSRCSSTFRSSVHSEKVAVRAGRVPSPDTTSKNGEPDEATTHEATGPLSFLSHLPQLAAWLFLLGATLGPPLDGIHSITGLQVYQGPAAVYIGGPIHGLPTSLWVFPLLGVMYVVIGLLQLWLDTWLAAGATSAALHAHQAADEPSQKVPMQPAHSEAGPTSLSLLRPASWLRESAPEGSWLRLLGATCVLIGLLRFSSLMYESEVPPNLIFAALSVCAHGNWFVYDRTLTGYFLAVAVAVGAPLCEAVLIGEFKWWEYSTPDYYFLGQGLVSWTSWCYFFYTQWVATIARTLELSFISPSIVRKELR